MLFRFLPQHSFMPFINKTIIMKKVLIDELVILDDCIATGTFKWRSDIDPNWKPRVWNKTFECWTKNYCG